MIEYASTTHWRFGEENPRLDWIDGSATLTMLRSRMTMNCATQQTARSQRVLLGSRPVDGAGSPVPGLGGASMLTLSRSPRRGGDATIAWYCGELSLHTTTGVQ